MNNTEYIIRKDSIAKQHVNEEGYINSQELLENGYHYILESMKKESFKLDNKECNIFTEILHENKVVGFATYMFIEELGCLALNEIYVMPEFRGNRLFLNEVHKVLLNNLKFGLIEPSHRIMEILYENGFADKYENILVSPFTLIIPSDSINCTDKKGKIEDEFIGSYFYDMNMSATIEIDIKDDNIILYYSRLLDVDIIEYGAGEKRKQKNEEYYNILKDEMLDNYDNLLEKIRELKGEFPLPKFTVKDVVGVAPELSEQLQAMIENNIITQEKAREIQEQITQEYEEGYVLPESLLKRLSFLAIEDQLDEMPEINMPTCIYCNSPIDITDNYCDICGFSYKAMDEVRTEYEELEEIVMEFAEELRKQGYSDDEIDKIITEQLVKVAEENNIQLSDDK